MPVRDGYEEIHNGKRKERNHGRTDGGSNVVPRGNKRISHRLPHWIFSEVPTQHNDERLHRPRRKRMEDDITMVPYQDEFFW